MAAQELKPACNLDKELLEICDTENQNDIGRIFRLLDQGANVNAVDDRGRTPLDYAAMQGNLEICVALLDRGAKEFVDGKVSSALHFAASYKRLFVGMELIGRGYAVSSEGLSCWTPLKYAFSNGHENMCLLLMACGASKNELGDETFAQGGGVVRRICGLTQLQAAVEFGDGRVLLKQLDRMAPSEQTLNDVLRAVEMAEYQGRKDGPGIARTWISSARAHGAIAAIDAEAQGVRP